MNFTLQRQELVELLQAEGIKHPTVLKAMATVPRHLFVPENLVSQAYDNTALPIDCGQTISQPYVVAKMTEALLGDSDSLRNVLEIGTGSGYAAAVLAQIAAKVYTIERIQNLLTTAEARFKAIGYTNIHTLYADGQLGWPEQSPYDAITVTAAAQAVPPTLLAQLAIGGRLVIPVTNDYGLQDLLLITKQQSGYNTVILDPVLFVPLLSGKIRS